MMATLLLDRHTRGVGERRLSGASARYENTFTSANQMVVDESRVRPRILPRIDHSHASLHKLADVPRDNGQAVVRGGCGDEHIGMGKRETALLARFDEATCEQR